jgi:hypothetical protein
MSNAKLLELVLMGKESPVLRGEENILINCIYVLTSLEGLCYKLT